MPKYVLAVCVRRRGWHLPNIAPTHTTLCHLRELPECPENLHCIWMRSLLLVDYESLVGQVTPSSAPIPFDTGPFVRCLSPCDVTFALGKALL